MRKLMMMTTVIAALCWACNDSVLDPAPEETPPLPAWVKGDRAPLYWTVYEYHRVMEKAWEEGLIAEEYYNNYIPEAVFKANIDWVAENLKPYGFDMVCADGWGGTGYVPTSEHGYRDRHSAHWEHDFAYWSSYLQSLGMSLGVYANPLWIDAASGDKPVEGTDIPISTLYNHDEFSLKGFRWLDVTAPGAESYVKGFVKYYASLGARFLRVDFLSWYETGLDLNLGKDPSNPDYRGTAFVKGTEMGIVGWTERPRAHYGTALRWMREACDEYGVFLSLVMPALTGDAALEQRYGGMFRAGADTLEGGWERFSGADRGVRREDVWPQFTNPFDGFVYWSQFTGPGKARVDGDFLRLNAFANDEERRSAISLMVMAGSPVAAADRGAGDGRVPLDYDPQAALPFYQNRELLSLSLEGFRAKPLSHDYSPGDVKNQIWTGRAANGDFVAAFFNREEAGERRTINFEEAFGFNKGFVRDVWEHTDEGLKSGLSVEVPAHGCKIYRVRAE